MTPALPKRKVMRVHAHSGVMELEIHYQELVSFSDSECWGRIVSEPHIEIDLLKALTWSGIDLLDELSEEEKYRIMCELAKEQEQDIQ